MLLLRFILIFAAVYYLLKLVFRWIAGSHGTRRGGGSGTAKSEKTDRYTELTDQKIEDAEYEELS
jgi:hypothetical protein